MPQDHGIEPAAPPRPPCCGAELLTFFSEPVSGHVGEFRRKRAFPYPGRISLRYTYDLINVSRPNPRTAASTASHCVGRRYIWICAVINIQQCSLSPFKHYLLSLFYLIVYIYLFVLNIPTKPLSILHVLVVYIMQFKTRLMEEIAQYMIFFHQCELKLFPEHPFIY